MSSAVLLPFLTRRSRVGIRHLRKAHPGLSRPTFSLSAFLPSSLFWRLGRLLPPSLWSPAVLRKTPLSGWRRLVRLVFPLIPHTARIMLPYRCIVGAPPTVPAAPTRTRTQPLGMSSSGGPYRPCVLGTLCTRTAMSLPLVPTVLLPHMVQCLSLSATRVLVPWASMCCVPRYRPGLLSAPAPATV